MADAAELKKCYLCKWPLAEGQAQCRQCGWDAVKVRRSCLKCGGWVLPRSGSGLSGPIVTAIAAVGALVSGFLGGFLGVLAVGGGLAAIGNFYRGFTLVMGCQECKKPLEESKLTADDHSDLNTKIIISIVVSGLLALMAVVAGIAWIFLALRKR